MDGSFSVVLFTWTILKQKPFCKANPAHYYSFYLSTVLPEIHSPQLNPVSSPVVTLLECRARWRTVISWLVGNYSWWRTNLLRLVRLVLLAKKASSMWSSWKIVSIHNGFTREAFHMCLICVKRKFFLHALRTSLRSPITSAKIPCFPSSQAQVSQRYSPHLLSFTQ